VSGKSNEHDRKLVLLIAQKTTLRVLAEDAQGPSTLSSIMNTSFNLRGEAIVSTPTDAIRTFFSSGMDALVLGSFLVEK
jgi:carbamoyltransferase